MHENIKISDNSVGNVDITKAIVQTWPYAPAVNNGITIDILRLDAIHPLIAGNKWFKLKYHLQQAITQGKKGLLTFGGAWSNHLVASAAAAKAAGLAAIGIVRGEKPAHYSHTLQDAANLGMELQFIARAAYADEEIVMKAMELAYPDHILIPAGGQSSLGVQGAAEILSLVHLPSYTHIAAAVGTGTMLAGLVQGSLPHQQVLGFVSLKIPDTADNSLLHFLHQQSPRRNFELLYQYHFGGYAKKTESLVQFMNELYVQYDLPTDLVYTGKLMFGIADLVHKNYFPANSRLLVVHSGGLQGNRSLAPGILRFS